jgi:predicted nucleotidyltransferase
VRYALVGAGAMAAHGVARSTFDVDLLTTDPRVLATAFWQALAGQEGVSVDVRTGDAEDPLAGIVRMAADGERKVDVVVGRTRWQDEVIGRAQPMSIQGVTLPVVTIVDLIVLKLYAGGSQDAWDIEQLLAAGDEDLIRRDVDPIVADLPEDARALWHRLGGPPPA